MGLGWISDRLLTSRKGVSKPEPERVAPLAGGLERTRGVVLLVKATSAGRERRRGLSFEGCPARGPDFPKG